jgi:hypothetical protein
MFNRISTHLDLKEPVKINLDPLEGAVSYPQHVLAIGETGESLDVFIPDSRLDEFRNQMVQALTGRTPEQLEVTAVLLKVAVAAKAFLETPTTDVKAALASLQRMQKAVNEWYGLISEPEDERSQLNIEYTYSAFMVAEAADNYFVHAGTLHEGVPASERLREATQKYMKLRDEAKKAKG